MTKEQILNQVKNFGKAEFHFMQWTRELKTKKGVTDKITKTTTKGVRFGVRRDAMASVKEKKANGELPEENQGLYASQEWLDDYFIQNTKTGNISVRVANNMNNDATVVYRKNGRIVDRAEIEPLVYSGELKEKDSDIDVFNVSVKYVDYIH